MPKHCRDTNSPWLNIPLDDYEGHMSLQSIGQADALSELFADLLHEFSPLSVAVIGCSGGNGFDHILSETTKRVVGVDINPNYLHTLSTRFADKINGLELYVCDVQGAVLPFEPVNFIYAALVFEYVNTAAALSNLKLACQLNGILVAVLQLPSAISAPVSDSPFTSLQRLAPVMNLVSPSEFSACATDIGFILLSEKRIDLQSGKQFVVQVFQLLSADQPDITKASKVRQ